MRQAATSHVASVDYAKCRSEDALKECSWHEYYIIRQVVEEEEEEEEQEEEEALRKKKRFELAGRPSTYTDC